MPRRLSLSLASAIAAVLLDARSSRRHRRQHHHRQLSDDDDDDFDDVDLRSVGLVSAVAPGVRRESLLARVDPTRAGITCRHEFT